MGLVSERVTSLANYKEDTGEIENLLSGEFEAVEEIGENEYRLRTSVGTTADVYILDKGASKSGEFDKLLEISGSEPVVRRTRKYLEEHLK
ncbi:MAG: hypothetical protein ABEK16_03480 [Candidatus Nanohalobium sp.]